MDDYVILNNGIRMPLVGLGVFRCGPEETFNMVKSAIEMGYRSIDTAMVYGNEQYVGEAIKASKVKREDLFITTKLWNDDQRNDNVRGAFEDSLKRLNVDYVDLYLIHWPVKGKFIQSWLELERLHDEDIAKAVGVSNFLEHHLEALTEESDLLPAIDQVECHPFLSEKSLLNYCNKMHIQLEAWSPLGAAKNGVLENEVIIELAKKYNKTPAQIILRWDIDCGLVTIPKSSNIERQKQNIDIFDFSLLPEEIERIDSLNKDERVGSDPDTFTF